MVSRHIKTYQDISRHIKSQKRQVEKDSEENRKDRNAPSPGNTSACCISCHILKNLLKVPYLGTTLFKVVNGRQRVVPIGAERRLKHVEANFSANVCQFLLRLMPSVLLCQALWQFLLSLRSDFLLQFNTFLIVSQNSNILETFWVILETFLPQELWCLTKYWTTLKIFSAFSMRLGALGISIDFESAGIPSSASYFHSRLPGAWVGTEPRRVLQVPGNR